VGSEGKLRFAIIGCGSAGKNRSAALPNGALQIACDSNLVRAEEIAAQHEGCRATVSDKDAIRDPNVDVVIVCMPHVSLAKLTLQAVEAGKHVLVEKPGGITSASLKDVQAVAAQTGSLVRVGFNHRYHPAFQKAYELKRTENFGQAMFVRGRYGHGGRIGFDKEWRAQPRISGGGNLLDMGVHLVDLAGSFLGEFSSADGQVSTYFWDMPVEDNAFLHLRTADNRTAWLHSSYTEWKNLFSFEIYFRNAKLHIDGIGRSYGVGRLNYYKMLPEMGPPDTVIFEFPEQDPSWGLELTEFQEDIALRRTPTPGLTEAIRALEVVEEVYRKTVVPVKVRNGGFDGLAGLTMRPAETHRELARLTKPTCQPFAQLRAREALRSRPRRRPPPSPKPTARQAVLESGHAECWSTAPI
jgi:predicted dehydrogenase